MSISIKILGPSCPKCKTTAALVQDVVAENNIDATIEKVEDIMQIMEYNVMSTPAIVIDEKIAVKGRIPSKDEILDLLNSKELKPKNDNNGSCCSGPNCC